jgi:hypothetical protein
LRLFDGPGISSSEEGNESDSARGTGDAIFGSVGVALPAFSACAASAAFRAARADGMLPYMV